MKKSLKRALGKLPYIQGLLEERDQFRIQNQELGIQNQELQHPQPQQNSLLDFYIQSRLIESRIKHSPVLWDEVNYIDSSIRLNFSVFDPYRNYRAGESQMLVDGKFYPYTANHEGDYLKITCDFEVTQLEAPIIQINFRFSPGENIDLWKKAWFVPAIPSKFKVPEAERLVRVIGDKRSTSYLVGGATHAMMLRQVLENYFTLYLDQIDLLDWGCGCGRVSQFLINYGATRLVGADIDKDNIQWCQDNLPQANFATLPLQPPTHFADNSFDAIIGQSVMTHLTEETHWAWLKEIHRILKPRGVALLTVRGWAYYHLTKESPAFVLQVEQQGYIDRVRDDALLDVIEDKEYYRVAYFSHGFIRKQWSKYFHVVDILEGLVLHDVVVLQKPNDDRAFLS